MCKNPAYDVLVGGRRKGLNMISYRNYLIKNILDIKTSLFIPPIIERDPMVIKWFTTYRAIVKHPRK